MKKLLSAVLALAIIAALAPAALAGRDSPYPVEGGNIYINWSTMKVTGSDKTITSAVIPDGIRTIDDWAFRLCSELTSVTIPDSVTRIGQEAFKDCKSLTSVVIPGGVQYIESETFMYCTGLTSVVIRDGVTSIGQEAFEFCYSLTSLTIPNSVTNIGTCAFKSCTSLTDVTIPGSVTNIGDKAFQNCTSLTGVVIASGVTHIEGLLFESCSSLTRAFIPASVTSIEPIVFDDCVSLTDIYFGGTEEQWNGILYDCDPTIHYNSAIPTDGFTDVGAAYDGAVQWAVSNSCADARSFTAFGSNDPCPRWEVVSILWKAMGSPEPETAENPFTDVSETAPYYKAILWAYENGITTGVSKTEFGVNATVKRGDAMTFIHRAANKPASDAANPFADVAAGKYYEAPVLWAVENGITKGTDDTHFSPEDPVTRAQMVTFLYRWLVENA